MPAPAAVGAELVIFRLAQPFAERRAEVVRRWRSEPNLAVLWASPETILSVSFEGRPNSGHRVDDVSGGTGVPEDWLRRSWTLAAPPGPATLPVYFDFEGSWSRRIGLAGPVSYPQGLPPGGTASAKPRPEDLRSLLSLPFGPPPSAGIALRFSASHLSRAEGRLLRQGWASHRVFPVLAELPPYQGGRDERIVLLIARLKDGGSLARLLGDLSQRRRISPFLAVEADGRVLAAMLSPAPVRSAGSSPATLGLFENELRDIEILREPIDTFFPVVDHRYDRLVPAASA